MPAVKTDRTRLAGDPRAAFIARGRGLAWPVSGETPTELVYDADWH